MGNKPLHSTLLKRISDLESQKSDIQGTRGTITSTADLINQADLDYRIKTTRIQVVVAQSLSASEILEHFLEDDGQIEFVDPENGYPVRGRLYQDKEQQTPVIALTPYDRDDHDMAIAVAECLKAYDEYFLEDGKVFESYDSSTEEMLQYENKEKFKETAHPVYPAAKEFGRTVEREIGAYEKMRDELANFEQEKKFIATPKTADSFIIFGEKTVFSPN